MNTAFEKFVSEKFFDKLFLLFLLAGTVFMACAKGSAVLVLTDSPWLSGVVCLSVFFTWQQVSLSQVKERSVPKWQTGT